MTPSDWVRGVDCTLEHAQNSEEVPSRWVIQVRKPRLKDGELEDLKPPPYVRVEARTDKRRIAVVLEAKHDAMEEWRTGENDKDSGQRNVKVLVHSRILDQVPSGTRVTCSKATQRQHKIYVWTHDGVRILLLAGLLVILGIAIDAAHDIGRTMDPPLWQPPQPVYLGATITSYVLKGVGVALAVWRGLLERD